MKPKLIELHVTVRENPGIAFFARCNDAIASCTSDDKTAVQRAAAKHSQAMHAVGSIARAVQPDEVTVRRVVPGLFLAILPEGLAV